MITQLSSDEGRDEYVSPKSRSFSRDDIDIVISDAASQLSSACHADGHWVFELEADATIPAEYIILGHFLNERDIETENRLSKYLRSIQESHGGWPLFKGGRMDLSCSVKAYWALKLSGDSPSEPHMTKARKIILDSGGAAKANVFTRTTLALFGEIPWKGVPSMPVEIIYLPKWFPFHLSKISYWSRTTLVPLTILMSIRAKAENPTGINVRELFCNNPDKEVYFQPTSMLSRLIFRADRTLHFFEKMLPNFIRKRAINRAIKWCSLRLNGDDGLGAIFPPMANLLMVLHQRGFSPDDEMRRTVRRSIDLLLTEPISGQQYCQPCVSPVWDTGLAAHAMLEVEEAIQGKLNGFELPKISNTMEWLVERQILDVKGDWINGAPDAIPGGWAFQYNNDYYPDVDDTAVVALALHRADPEKYADSIRRARDWIIGMQGKDGGWGAFDSDNNYNYLNHIPFADHGALLDPSTADVSARCLSFLCQIGDNENPVVKKAINFLYAEQEKDGSWFGRWGTNYIYGTWSVLCALNAAGESKSSHTFRCAVEWIKSKQREDGGWGETGDSYYSDRTSESYRVVSTPSQTSWAILGLMAAGEVNAPETKLGVNYLLNAKRTGPIWNEEHYTSVGFPRVFYLRYHGYSAYFPLWALARYRSLTEKNKFRTSWGL